VVMLMKCSRGVEIDLRMIGWTAVKVLCDVLGPAFGRFATLAVSGNPECDAA
jgi:hypothetical protein